MGAVRVYLAITVVLTHNGIVIPGIDGYISVQLFFIISGFFMALVLNDKYEGSIRDFYAARYIKLWPSYVVVLLIVLLFLRPLPPLLNYSTGAAIYTYFVSVTMFFYETLWWFGVDRANGGAFLFPDPSNKQIAVMAWLTSMAHMWSVGVELLFYAASPFLARKPRRLLVVFTLAYLVHILISLRLSADHPLRYKSALNHFWLFSIGMLSYWYWKNNEGILSRIKLKNTYVISMSLFFSTSIIILCKATYDYLPGQIASDAFLFAFAFICGPIFYLSRSIRFDGKIAQLSYPIYLVHWPITYILIRDHRGEWLWSLVIVAISIILAVTLRLLVDKPVEVYRRKFTQGNRQLA